MPFCGEYNKSIRIIQQLTININLTGSFHEFPVLLHNVLVPFFCIDLSLSLVNKLICPCCALSFHSQFILLFCITYINFFLYLLLVFLHLPLTFFLVIIQLLHPLGLCSPSSFCQCWPLCVGRVSSLSKHYSNSAACSDSFSLHDREDNTFPLIYSVSQQTCIKCLLYVRILQTITQRLFSNNLLFWWEDSYIMNTTVGSFSW